uniref:Uncharacterized protein n=1 Tax=Pararge aegeria TaxID=116150 RepID=S4PFJ7_9NEOP
MYPNLRHKLYFVRGPLSYINREDTSHRYRVPSSCLYLRFMQSLKIPKTCSNLLNRPWCALKICTYSTRKPNTSITLCDH